MTTTFAEVNVSFDWFRKIESCLSPLAKMSQVQVTSSQEMEQTIQHRLDIKLLHIHGD